ncbi:DUF1801 domain-containing protein [Naasia sp. SYSU D00948]|uniref:DUF1801 domain-containing protein n=1 Tax=Naasia sp. SYSU D00948 TaxID=2817379 RepID=UPI001B30A6EA|nr:DUF1801 domain-containing protein [Naasia sp. SYSU D00948]
MVEDDIEELLSGHPEEVRRLAAAVIAALRESVPEAIVKVAPGWHSVNFRHPVAGYLCGVFPGNDRVDVALEAGVLLSDPEGRLEPGATGSKRVRYLRFRPGDRVDPAVLDTLVQESIAILSRR